MAATVYQLDWLKDHPLYDKMVEVMGAYDDSIDYVGPQKRKLLVKLIPRWMLFMCDINICAYIHDYFYRRGGSKLNRADADTQFLAHIILWIEIYEWPGQKIKYVGGIIAWKWRSLAKVQARYYYMFVRLFGDSSFRYFAKTV